MSRGRVRLIRCYLRYIHASQNRPRAFGLRRLAKSGRRRVLVATALSLWCRAHFRTWWSLFMTGARETLCFGGPKSTFRDISWQVQDFGHGCDLRVTLTLTPSIPPSLAPSLARSLAHSLTHSPTHPPTHSPTHPLTHSPTHSPPRPPPSSPPSPLWTPTHLDL